MIPKDFPWRAGMLARARNGLVRITDVHLFSENYIKCDSPRPVLTDPATIGALATAVRDAYREPFMFALPPGATSALWTIHRNAARSPLGEPEAVGQSEGLAWLAAWEGRAK